MDMKMLGFTIFKIDCAIRIFSVHCSLSKP